MALFSGTILHADPVDAVEQAAFAAFPGMPRVQTVPEIVGRCGADVRVNVAVAYCTSRNVIFVSSQTRTRPEAAYLVAHVYGHAVQVRHGVADFALAQIRSRRGEEVMLRGLVTRQVECIAGFLMSRGGLETLALSQMFAEEPFTGAHWGRDPLRIGPKVSIGLAERDAWFQIGLGGDIAACAPGEFSADLLLEALRF